MVLSLSLTWSGYAKFSVRNFVYFENTLGSISHRFGLWIQQMVSSSWSFSFVTTKHFALFTWMILLVSERMNHISAASHRSSVTLWRSGAIVSGHSTFDGQAHAQTEQTYQNSLWNSTRLAFVKILHITRFSILLLLRRHLLLHEWIMLHFCLVSLRIILIRILNCTTWWCNLNFSCSWAILEQKNIVFFSFCFIT